MISDIVLKRDAIQMQQDELVAGKRSSFETAKRLFQGSVDSGKSDKQVTLS